MVKCGVNQKKVLGGETISIIVNIEKEFQFLPQDISLDIVYEDNDLIIINKPCNLVVHPGAGNPNCTLLNALLYYYPPIKYLPRAGIVHRLDKNTTGLMVVAKSRLAQLRLLEHLQLRKITREYEAIVLGRIDQDGIVNQPITRHKIIRNRMSIHFTGKPAITYYYVIENFRTHTHLRVLLDTGRTHQIRVHMSYINHPLVGDQLYGYRLPSLSKRTSKILINALCNFNRQALHATMLRLYHPIKGIEMEWRIPLPQDMLDLVRIMRLDSKEYLKII